MIDYVLKIADIPPFRVALRAEADAGNQYAYITEDTNEAKHNLPITGVIPKAGNATVSICRLTQDQYDWITGIPQVVVLGKGQPFIKELEDIIWEPGQGVGAYHAIHAQNSYDVDDGEGGTITIMPPELHGVLWS